jgi:cobyrinic acid a,c-diamide synthase
MPKVIVIAGTHSGCGKTLAALGLMAALKRRGLVVQPFKAGPDFIDPGHHEAVCGRTSHNLDGWMLGRDGVESVFARYAADADVAVIEGVMGLYDGASATEESGSTAEIAKWLDAPVLLVADVRGMGRSAAALVKGYAEFDPDLSLAGVVFNRVGSPNHGELLREALSFFPEVEVAGCLARHETLFTPSRHLGLVTAGDLAGETAWTEERVEQLAAWVEEGMDVQRLLNRLPNATLHHPQDPKPKEKKARIGVARDEAFCFYYAENFRLLEQAGAELVFFSPLRDSTLPPELDGLYFGGGYPELHAETLSRNTTLLSEILAFGRSLKPVYAECGGFMYLMDHIEVAEEERYFMVGLFDMRCRLGDRFRALGYREVVTMTDSPLGPAWAMLRGHEFHYSYIMAEDEQAEGMYKLRGRGGWLLQKDGFLRGNTLGSYVHAHFGSNPEVVEAFVNMCAVSGGGDRDAKSQ